MTTLRVSLPAKLVPVFEGEARFRGAYGGRGSGKTRSFAKMAALRAVQASAEKRSGIILCGREFMNSLDESSMAEVKAAIFDDPALAAHFDVGERYIRTWDKRVEFKFAGLRYNVDSIKSKARIILCWIDEAEPVSDAAWSKLIPTVREDDSEIWVTWNPETEGSATDKRFRQNPPPSSRIVRMNWVDNPWFPQVLREQMEWDRERDPDKFEHIWEGGYDIRSDARVFHNWRVEAFETPEQPRFYYGADWGYSVDPTVLVRCFIEGRTLYVDQEAYGVNVEIEETPALFRSVPGADLWPIVADSARPETISYMKKQGFNIRHARKGPSSVMDGIEFLKNYDIVVHPRCRHTADELRHYSWKVDRQTDEVLPILEDKNNHVVDALRYALEGVRKAKTPALTLHDHGKTENWARPA